MKRGDIYRVSLDPTSGREQQGERRVMIVSPEKFNRFTGTPLTVPITTGGGFARDKGFSVSLSGTGLDTTGIVRCDQARSLDLAARRGRRIEAAPEFIVQAVLAKLSTLLE